MPRSLLVCLLLFATAAFADERKGIAFVQAVEQGGGVCMADTPERGFTCAVKECTTGGAAHEDCLPMAWCKPAGWSVDVFLQHNEGVHWHEVSCGWAEKSLALRAASVICDQTVRQFIVACMVVQIYDPEGKPQLK